MDTEVRWKELEAKAADKWATVSCNPGVMTGYWVFIDRAVQEDGEHKGVLNRHSFRAGTLDDAITQAEEWLAYQ
jgi:hypothetical protein